MPTFTPPTREENIPLRGWWSRYSIAVGKSVVKVSGVMTLHPFPTLQELEELTEGVDYFLGGYTYTVTDAVADELRAAGFVMDGDVDEEDPPGFGEGGFGFGAFGDPNGALPGFGEGDFGEGGYGL